MDPASARFDQSRSTIVNARLLGPVADITQLHKVNFVMKGGKVIRRD